MRSLNPRSHSNARALVLAAAVVVATGCPQPASTLGPSPVTATPPPATGPAPVAPAGPSAPAEPGAPAPAPRTTPRLVVLLVIDQLPAWAFAVKQPHLTGGFARVLREGAWHTGEFPSGATFTAPGHALLGTGESPARSGIVANAWWHRDDARVRRSVEARDGSPTATWLRVPALGDAVAAAGTGGKAVSISLKDRAAILPLGQAGTPIWYDAKRAAWVSRAALPWLDDLNRAVPIRPRLAPWTPLDPARLALLSGTIDAQPGEVGERGFGASFPHDPAATKDPAAAVSALPLGNELVFEAAAAAIAAEGLGADDVPDLLVLSLSAYDDIGHGWGQESWESWDMTLRLDAQLERFLADLDHRIGAGAWAMLVTSDHGASPLPERARGGRLTYEQLRKVADRAAASVLGRGAWIAGVVGPGVYLSATARARSAVDRDRAVTRIIAALRALPGIDRAERTAELAGDCEARTGDDARLCLMLDPERSGEIVLLPAAGWIIDYKRFRYATAHGSLHRYDREVPVLLVPPGRGPARATAAPAPTTTIPMTEIATIVSGWLGITPPNQLAAP